MIVLLIIILAMRRWYIFVMMGSRLSFYFYSIPLSRICMMWGASDKCPSDISDKEEEGHDKMRKMREFHFYETNYIYIL